MGTKYLTLCLCHEDRSPVAAEVLEKLLEKFGVKSKVDSDGMYFIEQNPDHEKVRQRLHEYDGIFVMEDYMKTKLEKEYMVPSERVVTLNIPDIFDSTLESEREDLKKRLEAAFMSYFEDKFKIQGKNRQRGKD